jgi:hypothetical protein
MDAQAALVHRDTGPRLGHQVFFGPTAPCRFRLGAIGLGRTSGHHAGQVIGGALRSPTDETEAIEVAIVAAPLGRMPEFGAVMGWAMWPTWFRL